MNWLVIQFDQFSKAKKIFPKKFLSKIQMLLSIPDTHFSSFHIKAFGNNTVMGSLVHVSCIFVCVCLNFCCVPTHEITGS